MVECTIGVHQDLRALATNLFKVRHQPLEIAGRQRQQKPGAGPIRKSVHRLSIALGSSSARHGPSARFRPLTDAVEKKEPRRGGSGGEGACQGSVIAAASLTSGSIACCAASMHFLAIANLVKIAHVDRPAENSPPKTKLATEPPNSQPPTSGIGPAEAYVRQTRTSARSALGDIKENSTVAAHPF